MLAVGCMTSALGMERQYGAFTDAQVLEEVLLDSKNPEAVPRLRAHAVPALAQLLDERKRGPVIGEDYLTFLTALRCVRNLSAAGELLEKTLAVHSIPQLMCSILHELLDGGHGANDQHQLIWCIYVGISFTYVLSYQLPYKECASLLLCRNRQSFGSEGGAAGLGQSVHRQPCWCHCYLARPVP